MKTLIAWLGAIAAYIAVGMPLYALQPVILPSIIRTIDVLYGAGSFALSVWAGMKAYDLIKEKLFHVKH